MRPAAPAPTVVANSSDADDVVHRAHQVAAPASGSAARQGRHPSRGIWLSQASTPSSSCTRQQAPAAIRGDQSAARRSRPAPASTQPDQRRRRRRRRRADAAARPTRSIRDAAPCRPGPAARRPGQRTSSDQRRSAGARRSPEPTASRQPREVNSGDAHQQPRRRAGRSSRGSRPGSVPTSALSSTRKMPSTPWHDDAEQGQRRPASARQRRGSRQPAADGQDDAAACRRASRPGDGRARSASRGRASRQRDSWTAVPGRHDRPSGRPCRRRLVVTSRAEEQQRQRGARPSARPTSAASAADTGCRMRSCVMCIVGLAVSRLRPASRNATTASR